MLNQLDIRNFAIIDDLSLELEPGMSVLTGETGAGKSILLDALGLLLGDRADSDSIRSGAERAEISASFSLTGAKAAKDWLHEHELQDADDAESCAVRRVVSRDGRGRSFINGSAATTRDLKELGECLVDIHGQHEHQSLLRREAQREIVDSFGGHGELCVGVAALCRNHQELVERIESLAQKSDDGGRRIDFLRFQVQELESLALKPGEIEELDVEHKRLSNAGRLIEQGNLALQLLYDHDETAIYDQLSQAQHVLSDLSAVDSGFAAAAELVASAQIQSKEAADTLRHTLDGLELDPRRLQQVESRLADIHNLARKHRIPPVDLPTHLETLQQELQLLEGASVEVEKLEKQRDEVLANYRRQAETLHQARVKTAKKLSTQITEILRTLGMPQGIVKIEINAEGNSAPPRQHGGDQVDYLVSLNPGQEPRPLSRVASGGELSRISLAIQVIAANTNGAPTLVFDEVDAGIGGGVAEIVGRQLRRLGTRAQVLCVTHLAQVAAQASNQLQVRKETKGGQTFTRVRPLNDKERVEELARMIGGVDITAQTRAHAREMMSRAASA